MDEVKHGLASGKRIQIVDVRSAEDFVAGHILIAAHIALAHLKGQVSRLGHTEQYVVACGKGGRRSAEGAKLLKESRFDAVWICDITD